ncbi:MAG: Na/Pi cotransporter family protein [Candidatus Pacearchaeota archaeon]
MAIQIILLFLAGIALLLYSIFSLSRIMQQLASGKIKSYLTKITSKPIYGFGIGILLTAIFQSSSSTTVLTVSFVSAGLLSFFSSLGVIFGSNIGTTVTAQLLAFNITTIAPIIMVLGIAFSLLGRDKLKIIGKGIFYFGALFFGLELMRQAVIPLQSNPAFLNLLTKFENPVLAIVVSLGITALFQVSALVTGMAVLLGMSNAITLKVAILFIFGSNIGTTVTALLASAGGSISAKRTAMAHLFFNVIGVLIFLPLLNPFTSLVQLTSHNLANQIANSHLLFNAIMAAIFLVAIVPFSKLIERIVPGKEEVISLWPKYIDDRYLVKPQEALQAVKKENSRTLVINYKMFSKASELIFKFKRRKFTEVNYYEQVMDALNLELHKYLEKLSVIIKKTNLAPYLDLTNDLERIADRSLNIAEIAMLRKNKKVLFSRETENSLRHVTTLIRAQLRMIGALSLNYNNNLYERIKNSNEIVLEHLKKIQRVEEGGYASLLYSEILENLLHINEHCASALENTKTIK